MNKNWQNKLYEHEVAPPKGIWDSIAKELDKDDDKAVISATETKTVETNTVETKIVSFNFRRLAIAASIIAIAGLSGYWFLQNQTVSENQLAKETINKEIPEVIQSNTETTQNQIASADKKEVANDKTIIHEPLSENKTRGEAITGGIKKTVTSDKNILQPKMLDFNNETPLVKKSSSNPALKIEKLLTPGGEEVDDMSKLDAPHEYLSIIGPDGQNVRVSAKFSSIAPLFKDSEEYIDVVIKEAGKWKQKLKEWKTKMTYNNVTPSPNNFMDIIELSEVLNEK